MTEHKLRMSYLVKLKRGGTAWLDATTGEATTSKKKATRFDSQQEAWAAAEAFVAKNNPKKERNGWFAEVAAGEAR